MQTATCNASRMPSNLSHQLPVFVLGRATSVGDDGGRRARVGLWRRAIQFASGSALLFLSIYYIHAFMGLL
jgi:hypothetical protein